MKKIIFLGDSITDAGHNWNVDEYGLGNGYVQVIARELEKNGEKAEILNRGHDGFTISGILRFLEKDCISHSPDVVSVLVGCNNVGIMMNTGRSLEEQRFTEDYQKLLQKLSIKTKASTICMAPFIFPYPQEYKNWIPGILKVEEIIQKAAAEYGCTFIPLHEELQKAAREYGYYSITTDGIHLTRTGAGIIAEKWLKVMVKK